MGNATRVSGTIAHQRRVDLYVLDCPSCGVLFAITSDYEDRRREDGRNFYCPNQHHMAWPADDPSKKISQLEAQLVASQDQLEASAHEAEAVRVALLRDRQRFANGVCPCCNRSFENVRRHMTTKHPDYDATRVAELKSIQFACGCGRSFATLRGLRVHQGAQRRPGWSKPGTPRWSSHLTKV